MTLKHWEKASYIAAVVGTVIAMAGLGIGIYQLLAKDVAEKPGVECGISAGGSVTANSIEQDCGNG